MDDVYYTIRTNPKSDVILLKMDSDKAWFANASFNGTPFKFHMDSGESKSVMSSKWFMSIPELFRPKVYITRMKFQVANGEVLNAIGVVYVSIKMYGYNFKLPIDTIDIKTIS